LFLVLLAGTGLNLAAQSGRYRPSANFVANGKADQAEGARLLAQFHQAGVAGNYWLAFELRVMPHQGEERTVSGQLLGSRNDQGPITRLTLPGPGGLAGEQRWLIQSGAQPATWLWTGATDQTSALTLAETFQPLAGTDLTPFDLQMPFLYWTDFVYEGVAKVRGRPAHSYVLYPPANLAGVRPGLTGVRILLDTEFQAFLQAELLGEKGATEKTITLLDLKKVGEQWLPKSIDLRNHLTRDKTRLIFTAVALHLGLPPDTLTAAALATEPPAVPATQVEKF
jgi:Outer membrane lipoprotein-sorting protein